jgi:hypothetical protein
MHCLCVEKEKYVKALATKNTKKYMKNWLEFYLLLVAMIPQPD